ncbi:HD domain-containing protein [Streptomyces sp. NPDC058622]|uniref:HD domain-containing protein n=1 Tax=Streptomyces sp. NPDC058622 TaxID=3346562 RepID=UPI00365686A0
MTDLERAAWSALGAANWEPGQQTTARTCAAIAVTLYGGYTRDQGTPYIEHPMAVVEILREELGVVCPTALMTGLLHDVLEISPGARDLIGRRLGVKFANRLADITPDHRLEQRAQGPGDRQAWREKTAALEPVPLLIRLADRIHNTRDLARSPDLARRARFLDDLAVFYLPLAEARRAASPQLAAAYRVLRREYDAHQEERHHGADRVLHGTDGQDRRPGLPPNDPQRHS